MFRGALRPFVRPHLGRTQHRNFVSSVLLTRTGENKSVAQLKRESKIRGFSSYVSFFGFRILLNVGERKGNKANLFVRIQEHGKSKTHAFASHDPPMGMGGRNASTEATSVQSVSPGISPASQFTVSAPLEFMNMNIPDVSQPGPEPPIQIVRAYSYFVLWQESV